MSKKCELTGKAPLKGHKVSHSNNKVKRKFFPNLKNVTFKSEMLKRNITLSVSNSALRTVDYKGGLDFYLKNVKSYKLSPKAKKLKNKIMSKN
jgi:large subunit ribosomal protein L28